MSETTSKNFYRNQIRNTRCLYKKKRKSDHDKILSGIRCTVLKSSSKEFLNKLICI